jgi:ABC-type nickel/cobalt efflux system permease component RcnA
MASNIIEIRIKLKTELVLLLFAALFMSVGANLTVARNAAAQVGSATSTKEGAGHGNAEKGSLPAATSQPEEHGLPQKAVEIARPFGFPITNSMVVSWIVAVGLIIFARVTTRDMKPLFTFIGLGVGTFIAFFGLFRMLLDIAEEEKIRKDKESKKN